MFPPLNSTVQKDELISWIKILHQRFVQCIELGLSAAEAYDSFYRESTEELIAKATGE